MEFSNDTIAKQAALTPQQAQSQAGISVTQTQADPNFKPSSTNVPNVNDATALASHNGLLKIPTIPPSTTAAGISGIAQTMAEQSKVQKEQEQKATEAQTKVDNSQSDLKGLMDKILGIQSGRAQAEIDAGIDKKAQAVTDATNKIEASQRAQTNELRALEGSGLGEVQIRQRQQEINRRYAFEQADLALIQSAANRDYETASNILNRKIELQLEPLKFALDNTKYLYEQNKDTLTKAEDRAFQLKVNQLDQQYKRESENKQAIANIQLEALKQGVQIPATVRTQLDAAKDANEALSILTRNGITLENKIDAAYKTAQTAKIYAEIGTGNTPVIKQLDSNGNPIHQTPETQALQTILGSGKFTKDQVRLITNSINNGEDPFTIVKNQGKALMSGPNQTKVESYETARQGMQDLKSALQQYYDAGGKTSYLTGNYEKVINKLGEVTDPKLVSLATQIQTQLQVYRNAVSGTAYSVQEGADIASIFPGINKSKGLNDAIISGREAAFNSTIDAAYRGVLGSAYDNLKKASTPDSVVTPPANVNYTSTLDNILKSMGGK